MNRRYQAHREETLRRAFAELAWLIAFIGIILAICAVDPR